MKSKATIPFVSFVLVLAVLLVGVASIAQSPNGIRGAFTGDTYIPSAFKQHYGEPPNAVAVYSPAANTLALGASAGKHVGMGATNADRAGTCTLGTSCVVTFTNAYTSAPVCIATDQTAAAAVKSVPTTTNVTFTGTGTDVISYVCYGNPF